MNAFRVCQVIEGGNYLSMRNAHHAQAWRDIIEFGQCSDPEAVAVLESQKARASQRMMKLRSVPFFELVRKPSDYFLEALVDESQTSTVLYNIAKSWRIT